MSPSFSRFCLGAIAGATAGVIARVMGALVLNNGANEAEISYLLTSSWVLPKFFLIFLALFFLAGAPLFLWARKRHSLSWPLFVFTGAVVGYLSVFPLLLVPSWAAVHTFSGILAGLVSYAVIRSGSNGHVAL